MRRTLEVKRVVEKLLISVVFLLFIADQALQPLVAQSLDIVPVEETAANEPNQFTIGEARLTISGQSVHLGNDDGQIEISRADAVGWSVNRQYAGMIYLENQLRLKIADGKARETWDIELEHFDPMDETLDLLVLNDGRAVTRDNVANFTFFGRNGELLYSHSNRSGSGAGETVSRLLADPEGQTLLLYIPRIDFENGEGSLARVDFGEERLVEVYQSRERVIEHAAVSEDGRYLTFLTRREGSEDEILVKDRFGRQIASLESEIGELEGASLSENAAHLTIWTSGRVQVYRLPDLERIGSASVQQPVVHATYHEYENQMVMVTGRPANDGLLRQAEIQLVDIERREILRSDIGRETGLRQESPIDIKRENANRYLITGLSRELIVTARF